MSPRSKVYELPPDLRAELDRRLIDSGFGGYRDLAAWLNEQGYQIGKSALHTYGSALEQDFETTMASVQRTQQMAVAFAEANPDERGALVGATARIASETLLRITLAMNKMEDDPAQAAKLMPGIARALGDLGRLTISQEKWAQDLREQAAAEARAEAAAKLDAMASTDAKRGGTLDPATLRRIREEIYGIVAQPEAAG
jgi:hypothetical protein